MHWVPNGFIAAMGAPYSSFTAMGLQGLLSMPAYAPYLQLIWHGDHLRNFYCCRAQLLFFLTREQKFLSAAHGDNKDKRHSPSQRLFFFIGLLSGSAGGDGVGMCGSKGGMVFITPLPPQRALLARTAR